MGKTLGTTPKIALVPFGYYGAKFGLNQPTKGLAVVLAPRNGFKTIFSRPITAKVAIGTASFPEAVFPPSGQFHHCGNGYLHAHK